MTYTFDNGANEQSFLSLNMQEDLGITLDRGTTYYYFFVGRVNGLWYVSGIYSFTTGR